MFDRIFYSVFFLFFEFIRFKHTFCPQTVDISSPFRLLSPSFPISRKSGTQKLQFYPNSLHKNCHVTTNLSTLTEAVSSTFVKFVPLIAIFHIQATSHYLPLNFHVRQIVDMWIKKVDTILFLPDARLFSPCIFAGRAFLTAFFPILRDPVQFFIGFVVLLPFMIK